MMQRLVVPMQPVAKARPRVTLRKNGAVHTYTPAKTVHAENIIRDRALVELKPYPAYTALHVMTTFYMTPPKHMPRGRVLPVTKPDLDNLLKLVTDALEKFVYDNDSQITTAILKKRYADRPRVEIEISEDVLVKETEF